MPKLRKKKKDPFDTPEYRTLVEKIKKELDEAAAKGIDLRKRQDILTCKACGCYEDILNAGTWVVCDRQGNVLAEEEFILIDHKYRSYTRRKIFYSKTTYDFVCSRCGARQEEIVRDSWEQ